VFGRLYFKKQTKTQIHLTNNILFGRIDSDWKALKLKPFQKRKIQLALEQKQKKSSDPAPIQIVTNHYQGRHKLIELESILPTTSLDTSIHWKPHSSSSCISEVRKLITTIPELNKLDIIIEDCQEWIQAYQHQPRWLGS